MINGDLGDAAVDRAANCLAAFEKIERDPRGVSPRVRPAFEIVLNVEMLAKKTPFTLIASSLHQFELVKPSQDRLITIEKRLESSSPPAREIAKDLDPDGGVDQNHPRNFRMAL